MALTEFQRDLCRLIARNRVAQGESYIAGGAALNLAMDAARISRDLDLFHDTDEALRRTWDADNALLTSSGYRVSLRRERPSFVEAVVEKHGDAVVLQWVRDSAYRFFPLVEHEDLGLALHPFDLATNKMLALVGRVEARDWVDLVHCQERIQKLGYLAWAACGKDPGFSPAMILREARRTAHYSATEISSLVFEGDPPSLSLLSGRWREGLSEADEIIELLPVEHVGTCVLDDRNRLYSGTAKDLAQDLQTDSVRFHSGVIGGAFPQLVG